MGTRAVFVLFACASLLLLGCERVSSLFEPDEPPLPEPPAALAPPGSGAPRATRPQLSPGAEGLLRTLGSDGGAPRKRPAIPLDPRVRRSMKLGVRGLPGSELAFGKKRLGVLSETELVVRDTSGFREVVRLPLDGGRALAVLADGSLVAADRSRVVRLMPHDQKARTYPRISLLPGSNLFSDRVSPDRLWVLPGSGQTLFGYAVQGGAETLLKIDALVELEEFDRKTVGSLRDGSFLYTTASGFRQFHGTGKKLPLAGETSGIFRILPGSRPDTTWLLAESGRATLCRVLAGKLVRLHELALEAPPYDAVADGRLLAVLELLQPSDAPWSWVLEVFDESGTRRRRFELPAVETFDDEWVKSLTRNRSLALSADPAVVAVGGPTELGLWDLHKGERIPTDP